MKKIYSLVGVFILCFIATVYAQVEVDKVYTLYKTGNNEITCEVKESELHNYINDSYEWAIEPTTLMYTADGRTSYICISEVDSYKKVGWSTYPPVVIYKVNGEKYVLQEEVEDYIATGVWFTEPPINITMNITNHNIIGNLKGSYLYSEFHLEIIPTFMSELCTV